MSSVVTRKRLPSQGCVSQPLASICGHVTSFINEMRAGMMCTILGHNFQSMGVPPSGFLSLSTAPPNTMLLSMAWNVLGAQAGLSRPVVAICKAVSQVPLNTSPSFVASLDVQVCSLPLPHRVPLCPRLSDLPRSGSADRHCCNSPYSW